MAFYLKKKSYVVLQTNKKIWPLSNNQRIRKFDIMYTKKKGSAGSLLL